MKKNVSRWISRCACTGLAALLLCGTAVQAAPVVTPSDAELVVTSAIEPRGEEFQDYYGIYNGKKEYRVWSVTYGYWVTDWIDLE